MIQFLSGIAFTYLYISFLQILQIQKLITVILISGMIGLGHGFAFSFIMVILAEHHPIEKFQNTGFQVAIAHFFGHIIYGLIIGVVTGISGYLN